MTEQKIAYEPHPVAPERKAELRKAGYKIVDARLKPEGLEDNPVNSELEPIHVLPEHRLVIGEREITGAQLEDALLVLGNGVDDGIISISSDGKVSFVDIPFTVSAEGNGSSVSMTVATSTENGSAGIGTDSGEQLSDDQLRAAIEASTGRATHPQTKRETLIAKFNELNAQAAANE
ncbi:hypothetical protein [Brucella pituitosa]|uniref:hypothetical protein n=1 Tax=Brucella pituitosa TaxID=571256 RepID=UPI003F4AC361